MVDRVSALAGQDTMHRFGVSDDVSVTLTVVSDLLLHQVAAWPDTLTDVDRIAAEQVGVSSAPGPGAVAVGAAGTLLRIEPLKWWLLDAVAPTLDAEQGATLDLSHSRTRIRITGAQAATLLNRHMPLDLRDHSFSVDHVASTAFHHVGVTLWRSDQGYELFLPRGFAKSLWEMLLKTAAQFAV